MALGATLVDYVAFVVGAVFLIAAAVVAAAFLRVETPQAHGAEIGGHAGAEAAD